MQNRLAYICLPELFSAKERPWMKKSDQWKLQMAAMDVRLVGIGTVAEDGDTELRSAALPLQIGSQV